MTIVEFLDFLKTRLDEDEQMARITGEAGGVRIPFNLIPLGPFDPARVLREVKAKRAIVEEHPIYRGPRILAIDSSGTDYGCELCHCIDPIHTDGIIEAGGYCTTLRALALPYADHEDFQEEWRP